METFFQECIDRLSFLHREIATAIEGLPQEALDWTPAKDMNSIGVLCVHTAGAERYWLGDVVAGEPCGRNRDAEFKARGLDEGLLIQGLEESLGYSARVLAGLEFEGLAAERRSPRDGRTVNVSWCVLHVVEHTALHAGHIQITRQMWQGRRAR